MPFHASNKAQSMPTSLFTNTLATLGVLASLLWIIQLALVYRHRARAVQLADLPETTPETGWPRLAVIFAARNEETDVERATRSMIAQDYPNLEIIAVDDRSTDATGAILDRLAAENPALRVVHIEHLPTYWLGKNHALHSAADTTDASWILFTDADVNFSPDALRRAVRAAIDGDFDHITIIPEVPTEGMGERMFLSLFNLAFLLQSPNFKVDNPKHRASIGLGAFNLVRADAFRAIGGLRRLSLSIDDDLRLGQAMKWAGYRPRVLIGQGTGSVRWHAGIRQLIRGVEKNFFAALEFRLPLAAFVLCVFFWIGASPHIGLFVGPWWTRMICGFGILALMLLLERIGRTSRLRWYYALLLPISALLMSAALIRSVWFTLRRRGVTWRDHHYPIGLLREHIRSRDRWLRELWLSTR
jgi:cellulose synthase/poly-beta-1,6-N-acetylglucosamine synthase-like glycosyltransferase